MNRTRSVSKGVMPQDGTHSVSEGVRVPLRGREVHGGVGTTRRGFTLIEILIVVAVIVILAAIVMAIGVGVSNSAKERSTQATMKTLDGAMGDFLKDHPEPGGGTTVWVAALQAYPATASTLSRVAVNGTVKDGWGQAIIYVPTNPTSKVVGRFESAGRDGIMGNSDDVFSDGASAQP